MDTENLNQWRKSRLKALSDKHGGDAELGRQLGYRDGAYVGQMIRGLRPITEKTIAKLEQLPGVAGWFATDQNKNVIYAYPLQVQEQRAHYGSGIVIQQFDTGGSMGNGVVLRDQPGVIESWSVSQDWVQKNVRHVSSAKNLFVVTGFGDSMKPLYNPGDPLLIDAGIKTVDFDAVYFFRVGDEGFVKRLQRIPGQGIVALSDNPTYRDWPLPKDADLEIFGRVVKVWAGEDL